MTYLPSREAGALATKSDIKELVDRITTVETGLTSRVDRLEVRFDRLETRMDERFDAVNQRLDRLFLTLAAGLIAMIATVFAQAIL